MKNKNYQIQKIVEGIGEGALLIAATHLFLLFPAFIAFILLGDREFSETLWNIKDNPDWEASVDRFPTVVIGIAIAFRALYRLPIWTNSAKAFEVLPWTRRKPLPGGPLHFSARIWAMLFSASALGFWTLGIPLWTLPAVAMMAQVAIGGLLLFASEKFWSVPYGVMIAVLALSFSVYAEVFLYTLAFALYLPINHLVYEMLEERKFRVDSKLLEKPIIPWPASEILPSEKAVFQWRRLEWLLLAVVLGLFISVLAHADEIFRFYAVFLIGFGTLLHTGRYVAEKHPPITVIGRITKGPLIIPGYDRVFIPLIINTILLLNAWAMGAYLLEGWIPAIYGVAVFLSAIIVFKLSPSKDYWKLMAPGRLLSFPHGRLQTLKPI